MGGRKTLPVTITAEGRDKGKTFIITEMPAAQAEAWGIRALLAVAKVDMNMPDDFLSLGMAGFVMVGVRGLMRISWEDAKPLLDEMRGCFSIAETLVPGGSRAVTDDDIEEVATLLQLREEALTLHTGFSLRGAFSSSMERARQMRASPKPSTSRRRSRPSSQAD
jgi:hypothetical protein